MTQPGQQTARSDDDNDSYLRAVESDVDVATSAVAADLVRARTHLGLDIETVAEDLRIRKDHLEAIEGGQFDTLPGPVYVVGFLRSYANYLGLDGEDIVSRFKIESTGFEASQKLQFPAAPDAGRLPKIPLLIAALVMAGLGYVGWYYVTSDEGEIAGLIPEVPDRLADLITTSDDATGAPPEETEAASPEPAVAPTEPEPTVTAEAEAVSPAPEPPAPSTTAGDEAASEGAETASPDVVVVEPLPAPSAETRTAEVVEAQTTEPGNTVAAAEPAPANGADSASEAPEALADSAPAAVPESVVSAVSSTPAGEDDVAAPTETAEADVAALEVPPPPEVSTDYVPRVFGQANIGSRILVKARLESWVQVTGANNELLITRILRPGDVYHVPDLDGLMLMTGNAGGIDVLVDGSMAPSLGPVNAVRRNVALVPERLASGTAVP